MADRENREDVRERIAASLSQYVLEGAHRDLTEILSFSKG